MPEDLSTTKHMIKSLRHHRSGKDNDSTRTHHGSPIPQSPNVSDHGETSTGAVGDKHNSDLDLLGFGAQFDDDK
ncbi:hypothetical protein F4805DRAFT_463895 [Annulohypoxylon moriforme]|nr:hypothetical protein F4805DRAFT_463895 [Annulohypoxylon moriforme]